MVLQTIKWDANAFVWLAPCLEHFHLNQLLNGNEYYKHFGDAQACRKLILNDPFNCHSFPLHHSNSNNKGAACSIQSSLRTHVKDALREMREGRQGFHRSSVKPSLISGEELSMWSSWLDGSPVSWRPQCYLRSKFLKLPVCFCLNYLPQT